MLSLSVSEMPEVIQPFQYSVARAADQRKSCSCLFCREVFKVPFFQESLHREIQASHGDKGDDVNSRRNSNSWIQLKECSPLNFSDIPPSLLWDWYYQKSFAVHSPFPINHTKTRFKHEKTMDCI